MRSLEGDSSEIYLWPRGFIVCLSEKFNFF